MFCFRIAEVPFFFFVLLAWIISTSSFRTDRIEHQIYSQESFVNKVSISLKLYMNGVHHTTALVYRIVLVSSITLSMMHPSNIPNVTLYTCFIGVVVYLSKTVERERRNKLPGNHFNPGKDFLLFYTSPREESQKKKCHLPLYHIVICFDSVV